MTQTLDQLSAAATQGEAMSYAKSIVEAVEQGCNYEDKCLAVRDWLLRYRTGQLVAVADDATVRRLVNEYRETMDRDVLHSWAKDIVAAISALSAKVDA